MTDGKERKAHLHVLVPNTISARLADERKVRRRTSPFLKICDFQKRFARPRWSLSGLIAMRSKRQERARKIQQSARLNLD